MQNYLLPTVLNTEDTEIAGKISKKEAVCGLDAQADIEGNAAVRTEGREIGPGIIKNRLESVDAGGMGNRQDRVEVCRNRVS